MTMPPRRNGSVEERFDRESAAWRDLYARSEASPFAYHDKLYRRRYVLEMLGQGTGPVLDLGCGAGMFLQDLSSAGFAVAGADFSAEMVTLAARTDAGRHRIIRADAQFLPFRAGSFQALIGVGLLEYLPDDRTALAEFYRVLRPGGAAVVTLRNRRCLERRLWRAYTRLGWMDRKAQGFFREHDADSFGAAVEQAGFADCAYRFCHFYPLPWPLSKLLSPVNNCLAHRWERWFSRRRIPWLGSTIICRFRKPAAG
jgi:SAM-dependent methyltransferase